MPHSPFEPLKQYIPMRVKAEAKDLLLSAAIWRSGGVPDVLLIGVMKGGTTSLFNYLVQHRRVFPAIGKEIWYLSGSRLNMGESWYRRHFFGKWKRRFLEARLGGPVVTVDASADSICSPDAPRRAWNINPKARVIAVLRDPVKRAISQYRFQLEIGDDFATASLDEEISRQLDRLEKDGIDLRREMAGPTGERLVSQGLYWHMLKPWIDVYRHVCVVESESLFENSEEETNRVLAYLDLEPLGRSHFGVFNVTTRPSDGDDVLSPAVANRLREFYLDKNSELEDLVGQRFRWMETRPAMPR